MFSFGNTCLALENMKGENHKGKQYCTWHWNQVSVFYRANIKIVLKMFVSIKFLGRQANALTSYYQMTCVWFDTVILLRC